ASKNFDSTGLRLGYALLPENDRKSKELFNKMLDLARMRLSVNTPAQYAYTEGLRNVKEHKKAITSLRESIKDRVLFAYAEINRSEYMHAQEPHGAFYVFPKLNMEKLSVKNDKEFVSRLLIEKYVQITRGSGFGSPNHIRIVALAEKEILKDAIAKIEAFCKEHSK
ncbi:MAG: aminotransferase class I/II-fold pyridoxal phosphate-dependent enzyme, partial [Candidatus Parvarchaeum sp.]